MINLGWIIGFLYGTVAHIYDFMMEIVIDANTLTVGIQGLIQTLYSLVGIFMLFRISISLIQYLVSPDKVSDKNVGGSKLLVRIVISIGLIFAMPLVFDTLNEIQTAIIEGNYIGRLFDFNEDGTTNYGNISTVSYNENSLIDNVYAVDIKDKDDAECNSITTTSELADGGKTIDTLAAQLSGCKIDIVKRKISDYLNNYFSRGGWTGEGTGDNKYSFNIVSTHSYDGHVSADRFILDGGFDLNGFSDSGICWVTNDGSNQCGHIDIQLTVSSNDPIVSSLDCYYFYRPTGVNDRGYAAAFSFYGNGTGVDENGYNYNLCQENLPSSATYLHVKFELNRSGEAGWFKVADSNATDGSDGYYMKVEGDGISWHGTSEIKRNNYQVVANLQQGICPTTIDYAACNTSGTTCGPVSNKSSAHTDIFGGNAVITSTNVDNASFIFGSDSEETVQNNALAWLKENVCPVDPEYEGSGIVNTGTDSSCNKDGWTTGNDFARALVMSFIDDTNCEGSCATALDCYTFDSSVNEEVGRAVSNNKIDLDFFMAALGGLIAIVFMIIMVIEVVIRAMKLLLLRIISPIPIMSYINPDDKIFGQWIKMYLSSYADLFLKLIGIQAGFSLAGYMLDTGMLGTGGIITFVVYMAAFMFAKTVPNMISKVFGIDAGAGTFKDSFGMVKAGAGLAAGAAIGGVVGGISGLGSGGTVGTVLGGIGGGLMRGASGGAKGKLTQGAQQQVARNKQVKDMNAAGSTWGGRMKSRLMGAVGQKDAYEARQQEIDGMKRDNALRSAAQSNFDKANAIAEKDVSVANATAAYEEAKKAGSTIADIDTFMGKSGGYSSYVESASDSDISQMLVSSGASADYVKGMSAEDRRKEAVAMSENGRLNLSESFKRQAYDAKTKDMKKQIDVAKDSFFARAANAKEGDGAVYAAKQFVDAGKNIMANNKDTFGDVAAPDIAHWSGPNGIDTANKAIGNAKQAAETNIATIQNDSTFIAAKIDHDAASKK